MFGMILISIHSLLSLKAGVAKAEDLYISPRLARCRGLCEKANRCEWPETPRSVTRKMKVTSTVPGLRGEPHHIHLAASGAPTLDVRVQFAEEASKIFSAYREKYEFGASEMKARCGNICYDLPKTALSAESPTTDAYGIPMEIPWSWQRTRGQPARDPVNRLRSYSSFQFERSTSPRSGMIRPFQGVSPSPTGPYP